jgi:hypothetical protein
MLENTAGYNTDIARAELARRTRTLFNFQTLTPEQLKAGTPMIAGDNVGIIGAAGCGKSYIIKQTDNKLLLCPTGISAINAGGQTFHSFFRIDPADPLVMIKVNINITENMVVFDEIFFTSPVLLDSILTQYPALLSKQLIFTGDPYQLPPVKYKKEEDDDSEYTEEEEELIASNIKTSKGTLFDVLKKHDIKVRWVELHNSVRHKNDLVFADALSRIRVGGATPDDLTLLNTRVSVPPDNALVLTFRKALVKRYNEAYLSGFDNVVSYEAVAFDLVPEEKRELPWYIKEKKSLRKPPAPFRVALNCNVVVLYNDLQAEGNRFVNGDLGEVTGYDAKHIFVKLLRNGETIAFGQDHICKGKKYMGYKNFGLAIAKAMTIHKSQGCTIYGNVHIHIDEYLAKKWPGALYTAISRCGTLAQVTFNQAVKKAFLKQKPFAYFNSPENEKINS